MLALLFLVRLDGRRPAPVYTREAAFPEFGCGYAFGIANDSGRKSAGRPQRPPYRLSKVFFRKTGLNFAFGGKLSQKVFKSKLLSPSLYRFSGGRRPAQRGKINWPELYYLYRLRPIFCCLGSRKKKEKPANPPE